MSEQPLVSVFAQALYTDPQSGQWQPFSAGYSQLILYGSKEVHQYRLIGRNVDDNQFIINSSFTATGVQYQMATDTFHQYSDGVNVYGFNFYSPADAHQFAEACLNAVKDMLTSMQAPVAVAPPAQAARPQQASPYSAQQQSSAAPQAPQAPAAPQAPQPPPVEEDSSPSSSGLGAALGAVKLKKSAPPKEPEAPKAAAGPAAKAAPAGGMMGEMAAKLNKRQNSSSDASTPSAAAQKPLNNSFGKTDAAKAPEPKGVAMAKLGAKGSQESLATSDPPSKFGSIKKAQSPAAVKPASEDWEEEKKPVGKPSILGKNSFQPSEEPPKPAAQPAPKSFGSIKPSQPPPQPQAEPEVVAAKPVAKFPLAKPSPASANQPQEEDWSASGPPKPQVGKFPFAKKPSQPAVQKAPEPEPEPEPEPVQEPEPEPVPVFVPEVKKFNVVAPPKQFPAMIAKPVEPEPEPAWEEEAPAPVVEAPKPAIEQFKPRGSFGSAMPPPVAVMPTNMPPSMQSMPSSPLVSNLKKKSSTDSLSASVTKKSNPALSQLTQKATTETQVSQHHLGSSEVALMKQEILDTFRQELDSAKQEILDAFRTQIGQLYKDLTGQ